MAHVGVDHHGAGALVFPELWQHPAGDGDEGLIGEGPQSFQDRFFVGRVQEGKQEGHRHAVDFSLFQQPHQCLDGLGGQVLHDGSLVVHPLGQPEA